MTAPGAGRRWTANFCRNRHPTMTYRDPRQWQTWSPTFAWGYHKPDRFGVLRLGD